MKNRFLGLLFAASILLLNLLVPNFLQAQQSPPTPVVHPDHSVTFYLLSPGAKAVSISLDDGQNFTLTRNDEVQKGAAGSNASGAAKPQQGALWSVTTPPLPPDLYGYTLSVDGESTLDSQNLKVIPNLLYAGNELNVPASTPQPWDETNIPHGELHHHFYHSATVGDERDFFVYTPPGFDAKAKRKYPVLYLLHGFSDTAAGWSQVGKANFILDGLLAQGKARPMLVVMPLGYGASDYASRGSRNFDDPELTQRNFEDFRKSLLSEVLPQVEREYPVLTDRGNRAIAGLSMGGAESLFTGLNNVDKFAWIGAFSMGGITNGTAKKDYAKIFPALSSKNAAGSAAGNAPAGNAPAIKLLWISCGTSDHLLAGNRELIAWLKTQGMQPEAIETPGIHSWLVWRRNLAAFTPLLFR